MSWRIAKSLQTLRDQVNATWPNRDKRSDGSIGDAKHSSRKSDHNPNKAGVVCALDIDKDLSETVTVETVVNALVASRDPRIKYLIWRGRILSSTVSPWTWRKYTGANGHFEHLHISVGPSEALYDDPSPWAIGEAAVTEASPEVAQDEGLTDRRYYNVQAGDSLWKIAGSFGTSVRTLMDLNGLTSDLIKPGQRLRVR